MNFNTDSTANLGSKATNFKALEWSDQYVEALWSFYSVVEADNYFAARFGNQLIKVVSKHLPSKGVVSDYGCGSGSLTRTLAKKYPVLAVDFAKTIATTEKNFNKLQFPFPVDYATPNNVDSHVAKIDVLFFLEAVEHLLPDWIEPTFKNLHALLKPNGIVVCSTPNDEDIARAMVCCPACNTYFHKYQHMRRFTAASLAAFMENQGFETIEVKAYNLGMSTPYAKLRQILRCLLGKAQYPHLVYVGRKL